MRWHFQDNDAGRHSMSCICHYEAKQESYRHPDTLYHQQDTDSHISRSLYISACPRKMLVGNEVIVEETTKETAVETRECALVKMLSSTALANPFRELIKPYGCISDFLCFTESLIEIHEWESDIALRHDNGI